MNYDNNRLNAHNEIDHIFKDLFPTRNMAERPEQAALCHRMLCFTQYNDSLTRRFVERITVVDAETIQIKIRDTDVVVDGKLC